METGHFKVGKLVKIEVLKCCVLHLKRQSYFAPPPQKKLNGLNDRNLFVKVIE